MNATGKRRLLKLADFLETADLPGSFDMGVWADNEKNGRPACGTRACAMGWATTIPSFRRAGLFLNRCLDPQFEDNIGSYAAAAFFDISEDKARELFVFYGGRHTGKVARRLVARALRATASERQP